jgi:hypothetical protein
MWFSLCLCVSAVQFLAAPGQVSAWHRDGHFAIARMAWNQLDAGQQLAIHRLLKAHPHYDAYLAYDRPRELATEMEWAFLRASTWADWVRDPNGPGLDPAQRREIKKQFNKPVWHYVDLPYIHPNDVGKFDAEAIRKEMLVPAFDAQGEPRHVLAALEWAMKRLQAADAPDADRAVALTWLSHLVGDLHQPLHGTALIAAKETLDPPLDPPGGDQGGNRVVIKVQADSPKAMNLHFYWDSVLFADEPGLVGVDAMVAKFRNDPKLQRDQLKELKATDFLAWAEESLALAKSTVYQGKDGFLKLRSLPAKSRPDLGMDVPVLPDGYAEAARQAAARRMVLAGYRLADQLQIVLRKTE